MSRGSKSISSGPATKNFSSFSLVLPRNQRSPSAASRRWAGAMGYSASGYFSSRSLDGTTCSRSRIAIERLPPLRRGYGFGYRGAGFGYGLKGVSRSRTIAPITINEQLLQPLRLELDPSAQAMKHQEKEQIKALNNKFASFIEKVQFLEQQNEGLEMKWSLLQGQNHSQTTLVPMLEAYVGNLKQQLEALEHRKAQLETHQQAAQQLLETNKKMYKDECSQRTSYEGEFAVLKKDADCFLLNKAELEAKVGRLREEVEFLRMIYEEETQQLWAHISDTSVLVQMDNRRGLGMDGITAEVKAQYEDIARRSRAEAQAWYKGRFEELQVTAGRNATSLKDTRSKIAELTRMVQRLHGEVKGAKDQRCRLEAAVADAERSGKSAVKDAQHKLAELEAALQQTKADLTQQLREYQELMSIKAALDIEITTYKKLLEGEENRLCAEDFPSNTPPCPLQGGVPHSWEPSSAAANRNWCWTGACGGSSRSTRSSPVQVTSMVKSARRSK